jgi:predicted enzyme related to lactoylglutathione lyase
MLDWTAAMAARRREQGMGRVIHFELAADDVERAAGFYAAAFGWRSTESPFADGYRVADTGAGAGIDGAIMTRSYQAQPAIVWVEVDDMEAVLDAVRAAGGSPVGEVNTIPGQGRVTYVRDTEGNLIGVKQPLAK